MEKDFECYYQEYGQRVYNVAYRILRDHHAAEEVTQETFVRAWAALRSGFPPGDFEAGRLDDWSWSCSTSRPEAPPPFYAVNTGAAYAHSGKYGCQLAVGARAGAADVQIGQLFADTSPAYIIWLRPAGADSRHAEVLVSITDLTTDPHGYHSVLYRGIATCPLRRRTTGDISFRLEWGRWEAYSFDFARDYRSRYGREPGPHRVVGILLRHRAGGGPVELWVDDFTGAW